MIVEIGGGKGGLKVYLEHGKKQGRDLHRDQLDQRVSLVGDLDVFELVTTSSGEGGDKYDHITLSFSESYVSDEMLQVAAHEFRDHVLSAWPESERHRIAFYAEAHRPKILSYINSETGAQVERLTHIHIGLGKHDLLTGKSIEPLGYLGPASDNLKYLDAWQESFNARYGFSSPKDNPKITPECAIDVLARYTGNRPSEQKTHAAQKAAFEVALQKSIIAQGITSWNSFGQLLAKYGDVSKIREGKFGECYRVKPFGASRAMRLKGIFFQRQFIERPTPEKIFIISERARSAYLEQMQPRKEPAYLAATLLEWHQIKAREHRYVHTGSKFYQNEYKPASSATKNQLLDQLERKEHEVTCAATTQHRQVTPARNRVPGMPARNMDGIQSRTEMLLLRDASMDVRADSESGSTGTVMRQAVGAGNQTLLVKQTQPSNVLARIKAEQLERYARAADKDRYVEIRRHLDCTQLLAWLSHSHGIEPSRYKVEHARDRTPRIRCGTRSITPNDFLTKEIGLPWREAAPILRQVYEHQIGKKMIREGSQSRPSHLWRNFKASQALDRPVIKARLEEFDAETKAHRNALSLALKTTQSRALMGLSGAAKKSTLAIEKLHAAKAKADFSEQRNAARKLLQPVPVQAWRVYLQSRAQQGDSGALFVLRRLDATARDVPAVSVSGVIVLGEKDEAESHQRRSRPSSSSFLNALVYQVETNGDITYSKQGVVIMRDEGQHVAVIDQNSEEAIAAALLISVEKFGKNLTLTGPLEFQRRVVAVAVSRGIFTKFEDPRLESFRLRLIAEQRQLNSPVRKRDQTLESEARQPMKSEPKHESQGTASIEVEEKNPGRTELVKLLHATGSAVIDIEEGRLYIGIITQITEMYVVQKTGRDTVVVHELNRLDLQYEEGRVAEILYRDGLGHSGGLEDGKFKGSGQKR